jgi:hypothetical protein
MPASAQSVSSAIEVVDATVNSLNLEYRNKGLRENTSGTVQFGLFGNLVGAEVAVEQRIDVGKHDHGVSVLHTFAVTCSGFGCAGPSGEISTRDLIFGCDHGDITEEHRLAARKQAQAHAEKCRALPRPTA